MYQNFFLWLKKSVFSYGNLEVRFSRDYFLIKKNGPMQNEAHTSCVSNFSINWACHDLSKIKRNTIFISGRMRIISYVSVDILFFDQVTVHKVHQIFENWNFVNWM